MRYVGNKCRNNSCTCIGAMATNGYRSTPSLEERRKSRLCELWKSRPPIDVSYNVMVEDFSRRGNLSTLKLRYVENDQNHQYVLNNREDFSWGVSLIKWDARTRIGELEWRGDDDESEKHRVDLLGGEAPTVNLRKSASVFVKMRPDQALLRTMLLSQDQSCALTGERTPSALEAAHIVPVKANGQEVITNMNLLRADIHRLFDFALLWFDLSAGGCVRCAKSVAATYSGELSGRRLAPDVFERIRGALKDRAQLKGGCGEDEV